MISRLRLRIPIWAALAIPSAAYLVRSILIRHGDFSVDRADILVVSLVVCAVAAVVWMRHRADDEADASVKDPSASEATSDSDS
ncbi:MAG TPA: hypothetical protein VFG89_07285 [Coriobacteriia bacterium]|nr:hypothetical protein [Coriobacteriia bacterium]